MPLERVVSLGFIGFSSLTLDLLVRSLVSLDADPDDTDSSFSVIVLEFLEFDQ